MNRRGIPIDGHDGGDPVSIVTTSATTTEPVGASWHPARHPQVEILGIPVTSATRAAITTDLLDCLRSSADCCHLLFFVNAHGANVAFRDATYARALGRATWILNDGIGMEIAARACGRRFAENLNGSDLIDEGDFLRRCADEGIPVFLLGARPETLERAILGYQGRYPGLIVAGAHQGYFDHDDDETASEISARIGRSGARVLLVGLGVPLQEIWLARHGSRLPCRLAIALGGSLDQVAGDVPRAPRIWIRLRLEWLYRLFQEPRRLWRRYLLGNVVFLERVALRRRGLYGATTGAP